MIRRFGLGDRIVLSSFNHYTLLRCKAIAPELPCGILYECRIAEPQDNCRRLNMQYLHRTIAF
jgi:glycerophosphoryl diester phosphodiesterase